jgi:N-ethylmaleimide reductase
MSDSDPLNHFVTILKSLKSLNLAFIHFAFVTGTNEVEALKTFRDVYGHNIITNGAYSGDTAEADLAAGLTDATAFGVPFLANPDLPERLKTGAPLNEANPATFYGGNEVGFTDYPALAGS